MKKKLKTTKNDSGLTLLELLAVILMTSIIIMSIGSVVYYTVDAVNMVEAISREQEIEEGLDRILTEDMRLMCIEVNREFVEAHDRLAEEEGDIVTFVIDSPRFLDLPADQDDVKVTYLLDGSPDRFGEMRLLRREVSALYGEKKYTAIVYDRVLSVEIQFLDKGEWTYAWDARAANDLPAAIKWNLEIIVPSEYTRQSEVTRKIEVIIDVLTVSIGENNDDQETEEPEEPEQPDDTGGDAESGEPTIPTEPETGR